MVKDPNKVIEFFPSSTRSTDPQGPTTAQNADEPIPMPLQALTAFQAILRDPSLARAMHTPDYFLLVE
jgi:hypothetical protein